MMTFPRVRQCVGLWVLATTFAAAAAAVAYEGTGVTDGGTITGRVRIVGDVVPLPPQPVHKEIATCGSTVRDDRLVVGDGGALQFAVVTVNGITKGKPVPQTDVALHNRLCAFVPHVTSATKGQMLQIVNDDPM